MNCSEESESGNWSAARRRRERERGDDTRFCRPAALARYEPPRRRTERLRELLFSATRSESRIFSIELANDVT
jgi:hypothetical protein